MKYTSRMLFVAAVLLMLIQPLFAIKPGADQISAAHKWAAARFCKTSDPESSIMLYDTERIGIAVMQNNDSVLKDTRGVGPLRIGKDAYDYGLFVHAPSIATTFPIDL